MFEPQLQSEARSVPLTPVSDKSLRDVTLWGLGDLLDLSLSLNQAKYTASIMMRLQMSRSSDTSQPGLWAGACVCRKWKYALRQPCLWKTACLKAWQVRETKRQPAGFQKYSRRRQAPCSGHGMTASSTYPGLRTG